MPPLTRLTLIVATLFVLVPSGQAAYVFTDINPTGMHADAIEYLKTKEIVTGYKDGTFREDRTVNRAEFAKILAKSLFSQDDIDRCTREFSMDFTDVPRTAWFGPYACILTKNGFVEGYEDKTFRPSATLNIAEAAKIFVAAMKLPLDPANTGEEWFAPAIRALAQAKALPTDVRATGESLTRGVMAEMLWRLKENVQDRQTVDAETLLAAKCEWFADDVIPGVDLQEVRRVWLSWMNDTRKEFGLAPYVSSKQLNRTAAIWSQKAKAIGTITHKRTVSAAYYSYTGIESWFDAYDLTFENDNRATFTENIGWGMYKCNKQDCTQNLIDSIRTTYDMYLNERGKASSPHWNSIVKPEFTEQGMGISVDPASGKYYLTAHYATAITSDPDPVCP